MFLENQITACGFSAALAWTSKQEEYSARWAVAFPACFVNTVKMAGKQSGEGWHQAWKSPKDLEGQLHREAAL